MIGLEKIQKTCSPTKGAVCPIYQQELDQSWLLVPANSLQTSFDAKMSTKNRNSI